MSQSSSVAVTEGSFWNCGREMFVNVMLVVDELQYIMGRISKDTMRTANDLFWKQGEWRTTLSNLTCEAATSERERERERERVRERESEREREKWNDMARKAWNQFFPFGKRQRKKKWCQNCFYYPFSLSPPHVRPSSHIIKVRHLLQEHTSFF